MGRPCGRRLGCLPRQAGAHGHARREPHRLRRSRRRRRLRTSSSRRPTRPGRPTTATAATASTSGSPDGRAYKVSYNRPFTTRGHTNVSLLFSGEYPMIRWLERNGYDVSYSSGVDTARRGTEILEHKAFLSVGHDEYWSAGNVRNVEAARDAGVESRVLQRQRDLLEDALGAEHRRHVDAVHRPSSPTRRPRPTPRSTRSGLDGNVARSRASALRPTADARENALTGTIFTVNSATARTRSRCRRRSARCASGATRASRPWRPAPWRRFPPERSVTSGTRISTTAAARPGSATCRRRRCTVPTKILDDGRTRYGQRHGDALASRSTGPRAAPSSSAPARCSGAGDSIDMHDVFSRQPPAAGRRAHAAGDGEPLRRHERRSRRRCQPEPRRRRLPSTDTVGADLDDHGSPSERRGGAGTGTPSRSPGRRRTPAAGSSQASRCRQTVARHGIARSGESWSYILDRRAATGPVTIQSAARSTTAATSKTPGHRRDRRRHVPLPCSGLYDRRARHSATSDTGRGRARRQVPRRRRRLGSAASASTRGRGTPARTSAASGRAAERCSPARRSLARAPAAGRRCSSTRRSQSRPGRSTSPPTTRPPAATR